MACKEAASSVGSDPGFGGTLVRWLRSAWLDAPLTPNP